MQIPTDIHHDEARQLFEASLEGDVARCEYRRDGAVLHLDYTEVPRTHRGRGIAGTLVQAALDYARSNGFKVVPGCSYVRAYMRRHPQTLDLLA